MKNLILILLVSFSPPIFSMQGEGKYEVQSAKITYNIKYLLKNIKGTSTNIKGGAHCSANNCNFLIATPVKSFKSKDTSRDLNMLTYTKASKNPIIKVRLSTPTSLLKEQKVNLHISFAGIEKVYKDVKIIFSKKKGLLTKATISLKLSDFKIERPSLLGISIDDTVQIKVSIFWKKNS